MTQISEWFEAIAGGASLNEVSKRSGIPIASLHRYVQNGGFTPESVVKIARAFDASIPDALIAHGVVTREDLESVSYSASLSDASDQQLLDEIASRLARAEEGTSEVFDSVHSVSDDAVVHQVDFSSGVDDERAAASEYSVDRGEDDGYDA